MTSEFVERAWIKVKVQYNAYARDIDRIALVIYAKDSQGNWHVRGDYVDASGCVLQSEDVVGNSKDKPPLQPSTSAEFTEEEEIVSIAFEVVRLNPSDDEVSLKPDGNFAMPQ